MLSGKLSRRRTTRRKRELSGRRSLESTTGVTVFAEVDDTFAQTALKGGELAQPGAMRASEEGECAIVATSVACFAALVTGNTSECSATQKINANRPTAAHGQHCGRKKLTARLHYTVDDWVVGVVGCALFSDAHQNGGVHGHLVRHDLAVVRVAVNNGRAGAVPGRLRGRAWGNAARLSPSAALAHTPMHVRYALANTPQRTCDTPLRVSLSRDWGVRRQASFSGTPAARADSSMVFMLTIDRAWPGGTCGSTRQGYHSPTTCEWTCPHRPRHAPVASLWGHALCREEPRGELARVLNDAACVHALRCMPS